MHEQAPILQAKNRERTGSRYCKRIRAAGGLPAVVYGHGRDPVSITVDSREALSHFHAGEKVFRLDFPGTKSADEKQFVLVKELQFDYLGTQIVHADFARVDLNEKVHTRVAVHLIGEAKGLKQAGAILMHPVTEIEIECKVLEIPDFIEVDVAELDVGHAITAGDVKLPNADMRLITDKHGMVAQIIIQQEIKVGEETAAVAGAAEPEVITAKKPAEGEEAAAGKDAKGGAAKPAAGAKAPAAAPAGAKPAAKK
ncbi:MAG: 50S ribosomal protein L25 [Planctomycetes bacterium]|nr:50S ribosomal protein L25 [Planctomycetota bacterium]